MTHLSCYLYLIWFLYNISVSIATYVDIVCYRTWYLDSPRPAPRRCPNADFLTYYECCGERDDCCRRLRAEPIIFLIVIVTILIIICFCCVLGFVVKRRPSEKRECSEDGEYREREIQLSQDERECQQYY